MLILSLLDKSKCSDVVNYIKATEFAVEKMKTLPLCNRLVDSEILIKTNNANRNRVFSYEKYLEILRKDT